MRTGLPRRVRAALTVAVAITASLLAPVAVGTSSLAAARAPACGEHTDLDGLVGHASPVILAHGWTGAPMQDAREVFESLPSNDGRQYLLFDYAAASSKWPDVPEISRCLAGFIHDVSRTNRSRGGDGMVYLVAHSMGGLAIRFALDPAYGGDPGLADSVGGIVTLDTPYRGSMWGSSFFAWAKSAFNDAKHLAFPSAGSSAWRCLSAGPPSGCAVPPALPEQVPLTQVAGDVTVRRTLFGLHAYDIDLGSDGIVDLESQWGSVGADGKMVATQADVQMVPCTVSSGDLSGAGPVGFWADLASDNFLIDLYTKPHSPNDARAIGAVTTLLKIMFAAQCSHVTITHNRPAIKLADAGLAEMIRRQAGLGKVSDLRNALIPASCRHPAARLRGYRRDWEATAAARAWTPSTPSSETSPVTADRTPSYPSTATPVAWAGPSCCWSTAPAPDSSAGTTSGTSPIRRSTSRSTSSPSAMAESMSSSGPTKVPDSRWPPTGAA